VSELPLVLSVGSLHVSVIEALLPVPLEELVELPELLELLELLELEPPELLEELELLELLELLEPLLVPELPAELESEPPPQPASNSEDTMLHAQAALG
jgi:hypothetical protein